MIRSSHAGMVKSVDTRDLKSLAVKSVPVRVRLPAPNNPDPIRVRVILLLLEDGLELIQIQRGWALSAAAGCSGTLIFAKGENANRVRLPAPKHSNPNLLPIGETFGFVVLFFVVIMSIFGFAYCSRLLLIMTTVTTAAELMYLAIVDNSSGKDYYTTNIYCVYLNAGDRNFGHWHLP